MAQGDYDNAILQLEKSLQLYRENGSQQQYRVEVLSQIALFHYIIGESMQAVAYGEEAVHLARSLGDPRVRGDAFTRMGRILVRQGQLDNATELFHQALADFRQTEQDNHTMMPIAGLAEIALRQGEVAQAQGWVEQILSHLETHQLDCTDEELYVYMTGYHVLSKLANPRAATLLKLAHAHLQTRAASLEGAEALNFFWSAPPHAAVLAALD